MSRLCGFVWCNGYKDFQAWEVDNLSDEDINTIETILAKYDTYGTAESNVYHRRFSDAFSEDYLKYRELKLSGASKEEMCLYEDARKWYETYRHYSDVKEIYSKKAFLLLKEEIDEGIKRTEEEWGGQYHYHIQKEDKVYKDLISLLLRWPDELILK